MAALADRLVAEVATELGLGLSDPGDLLEHAMDGVEIPVADSKYDLVDLSRAKSTRFQQSFSAATESETGRYERRPIELTGSGGTLAPA